MSKSIENERTFLATAIPEDQFVSEPARLVDAYLPADSPHPKLRLRDKDGAYEITKKIPIDNDPSRQTEHTITLSATEFHELADSVDRRVEKVRVGLTEQVGAIVAEVDVFGGKHTGLVLVDFEFENEAAKDNFSPPEYCASEVTYEDNIAGGILSGLGSNELFGYLHETYGYEPVESSAFVQRYLGAASSVREVSLQPEAE